MQTNSGGFGLTRLVLIRRPGLAPDRTEEPCTHCKCASANISVPRAKPRIGLRCNRHFDRPLLRHIAPNVIILIILFVLSSIDVQYSLMKATIFLPRIQQSKLIIVSISCSSKTLPEICGSPFRSSNQSSMAALSLD
jgi:hypothetical protein